MNETGLKALSEADTTFSDNSNELKTKTSTQLESINGALQEKIGGSANAIKDLFENVIQSANEPKEILEKAWNDILSMELNEAEKTWHLVGRTSISNFIIDMFKRTKRSCLIAVPKFTDLPIQIIISELQRKALMIVTDVYDSPEKESISKLIDLGADLRHLSGVDFYAASRDREEVLLAPVSEKDTEQVALVSEVEGIIDTLGEILGDYWRGKAKKVREIT
jgi:sugar-specific transcriptional regulator TrmB